MDAQFGAIELPIDGIRSPKIQWAYDYWLARKGDRDLPSRADFLPEDMRPILGSIMLLNVTYEPLTLRYALYGTEIVDHYGHDLTGQTADNLEPKAFGDLIIGLYMQVIEERRPMIHNVTFETTDRYSAFERLMLPLASDGGRIDKILTVSEYQKSFFQVMADDTGVTV